MDKAAKQEAMLRRAEMELKAREEQERANAAMIARQEEEKLEMEEKFGCWPRAAGSWLEGRGGRELLGLRC